MDVEASNLPYEL